ncbi:MAG: hypothetical protein ACSLEM_06285 [Candidatus Malihini olakiniferum]
MTPHIFNTMEQLETALSGLPAPLRGAFLLAYLHGMYLISLRVKHTCLQDIHFLLSASGRYLFRWKQHAANAVAACQHVGLAWVWLGYDEEFSQETLLPAIMLIAKHIQSSANTLRDIHDMSLGP